MRGANLNGAKAPTDVVIEENAEEFPAELQQRVRELPRYELVTKYNGVLTDEAARLYSPFALTQYEQHPYHKFFYVCEEAINQRLNSVFGVDGWSLVVTNSGWVDPEPPTVKRGSTYIPLADFIRYELPPLVHIVTQDENGDQKYSESMPIATARAKAKEIGAVHFCDADESEYEKIQRIRNNGAEKLELIYDIGYYWAEGYIEAGGQRRYSLGFSEIGNLGKEPGIRKGNTRKAAYTDLLKRCARQYGVGLELTELDNKINDLEKLREWLNERYPNDPRYWKSVNDAKVRLFEDLQLALPEYYKGTIAEAGALIKAAREAMRLPDNEKWLVDNFFAAREQFILYGQRKLAEQ